MTPWRRITIGSGAQSFDLFVDAAGRLVAEATDGRQTVIALM